MRLVASGAAGGSGFRSAEVFRAGKFVAAVIDNVAAGQARRDVGAQLFNLDLNGNYRENHKELDEVGRNQDAIRNQTEGSFPGEPGIGTRQGRLDGADELLPARGPLDQQLELVVC